MTSESRSISYGNVLPTERYALPLPKPALPRFEWPSQWASRRLHCLHCRVLLYPTSTPTPTELIVAVDCWSCGRTLCELVPDGYHLGPVPMCVACCGRPATRRRRLCDGCMEAQQQAARMRRQHEFRAREQERLTLEEREARRQARNARRRSVAEGRTPEQREAVNAARRLRRSGRVGVVTR